MSVIFTSDISMDDLRRYFRVTGVSDLGDVRRAVGGRHVGYYFGDDHTILSGTYQDEITHGDWFVFVLRHDDETRFVRDILVAPRGQQHKVVFLRRNVRIHNAATDEDQWTDIYIVNVGRLDYVRFGVVRWGRSSDIELFIKERDFVIGGGVRMDFLRAVQHDEKNYEFCGGRFCSDELSFKYWGEVFPTS